MLKHMLAAKIIGGVVTKKDLEEYFGQNRHMAKWLHLSANKLKKKTS